VEEPPEKKRGRVSKVVDKKNKTKTKSIEIIYII